MGGKQRLNQIISGVALLLMGFFALCFTLGLALLPEAGGAVDSGWFGSYHFNSLASPSVIGNALIWLLIPVPAICAFEGALWRLREGRRMRENATGYSAGPVYGALGTARLFGNIGSNLLFVLLMAAIDVVVLHEFLAAPMTFSVNVVFYAVTVVLYLIFRRKIAAAFTSLGKKMRKGNPTYELTEEGVRITLFPVWVNKQPAPEPVNIRFDEIDELKVLTYAEAESLLKYQVGPDLNLPVRQTQDYVRYARREIPRPSVYTFGTPSSNQKNRVFIKGQEIFYLLEFDADDVTDLMEAYQAHRSKKGM